MSLKENNCLLHDTIEGHMTEEKGVGGRKQSFLIIRETEEDIGS